MPAVHAHRGWPSHQTHCLFAARSITRYTSRDILTIREAVWLTDNTYKYEDLVRMMGEVMAVLEGKIRVSFNVAVLFASRSPKNSSGVAVKTSAIYA